MYYKDRDIGICLLNCEIEWQGKICLEREVNKEILLVIDREDFFGSSEYIYLDISEEGF